MLITGCSSGIGRATAVELPKRGHEVTATARDADALRGLDVARRLTLDVASDESVAAAVAAAGELDGLVNNAGVGLSGPVERVPIAEVRRLFDANVLGAVRMMQAVLPGMRVRGRGVIVNVSSIAGRVGVPLSGYYSASKHALEAISETLHLEVGRFGVRVAIVEPGYIDTRFSDNTTRIGDDTASYDELRRVWEGGQAALVGGPRPGPEGVAAVVADAVEGTEARLRWPASPDAELVLGARAAMGDETFEATMRATLGVDW